MTSNVITWLCDAHMQVCMLCSMSMNHARAKLATVDEKLEERVYVFYSAERETRTPWISSEDEFEKLSDPGNVLFESIVGVCAFLFF